MRQSVRLVNVRWCGVLLVMGLLFLSTTTVFAQEEPVDEEPAEVALTTQVYMPLVSTTSSTALAESEEGFQNFSKEELRVFVDKALAEKMTVKEVDEIYNKNSNC